MSPEVAQSGGSGISAFAPLSGVKQTSDERVENDAIDRTRTFDAHIHCTMCYLRLRRRLSLLLFAAIRGINVPVFKGQRFGEEADGLRLSGCYSFSFHDPSWRSALCGRS